jgi:hypothetical protein
MAFTPYARHRAPAPQLETLEPSIVQQIPDADPVKGWTAAWLFGFVVGHEFKRMGWTNDHKVGKWFAENQARKLAGLGTPAIQYRPAGEGPYRF